MAERESSNIAAAVAVLRTGGLVAFPTETVYGLGADATRRDAVLKIFAAKGRRPTNPLIVHVADIAAARRYSADFPEAAQTLADAFWPGPLTLVVPASPQIAPEVTAGLGTVGLRAPRHPVAMELLRAFDGPIAAPSANRSTRLSPTTADHVRAQLGDKVDIILDGGPCEVGIESTVLSLAVSPPMILRPGAVSRDQIENLIGPVNLFAGAAAENQPAAGPGMSAVHYSPDAPLYLFNRDDLANLQDWRRSNPNARAVILTVGVFSLPELSRVHLLISMPDSPAEYARLLFSTLHSADQSAATAIWVELPPANPAWHAIHDRLTRASRPFSSFFKA